MSDHVHQYADWMEHTVNGGMRGGYRCSICHKTPVDVQREADNERAIVLAWLGRPKVVERINALEGSLRCDSSYPVGLQAALRQLAEEGK